MPIYSNFKAGKTSSNDASDLSQTEFTFLARTEKTSGPKISENKSVHETNFLDLVHVFGKLEHTEKILLHCRNYCLCEENGIEKRHVRMSRTENNDFICKPPIKSDSFFSTRQMSDNCTEGKAIC